MLHCVPTASKKTQTFIAQAELVCVPEQLKGTHREHICPYLIVNVDSCHSCGVNVDSQTGKPGP
jgi:hypothetical protein